MLNKCIKFFSMPLLLGLHVCVCVYILMSWDSLCKEAKGIDKEKQIKLFRLAEINLELEDRMEEICKG